MATEVNTTTSIPVASCDLMAGELSQPTTMGAGGKFYFHFDRLRPSAQAPEAAWQLIKGRTPFPR